MEVDVSGNDITTPGGIQLTGFAAPGTYGRYSFGGSANAIQVSFGGRQVIQSYWGIEVRGNFEPGSEAACQNYTAGSSSDASMEVIGTMAAAPVLVARGAASQSAPLQEWRNASGTVLSKIDAAGKLGGSALIGLVTNIYASGGSIVMQAGGTNWTVTGTHSP